MGSWEERRTPWWVESVVHCACCGQMIPRAVWRSEAGLGFCGPACEALYERYWRPRHGDPTARP